jgi:alpha-galactosidase
MATIYDPENLIARMPPMGWNSYNTFGGVYPMPDDVDPNLPGGVGLDSRVVLETAEAIVSSGLRDAGYSYLNLDDRWQDPRQPRDATGVLQCDRRRFPDGMKALGDSIHALGLKFGLYTVANILACGGEEGAGPNGFPMTGSLGREFIDAQTFAIWGIDFLKIDWCGVDEAGNSGRAREVFTTWNRAIAAAGRPVLLSASTWGHEDEADWAPKLTHMWRTGEDLPPRWDAVIAAARLHASPPWSGSCGPLSGWNDPDMLEVGRPGLTPTEWWTHLVLSALTASPLLLSHDVRNQTPAVRDMVLDPDIIRIDQMDTPVATVETIDDGWDLWQRRCPDGSLVEAVVNLTDETRLVPDSLWREGCEIGPTAVRQSSLVAAHGVRATIAHSHV